MYSSKLPKWATVLVHNNISNFCLFSFIWSDFSCLNLGAPVLNGGAGVVYSSEEEYVGSSDDDEDFIVPAKYVRITTLSELVTHQIQVPISYDNTEEVKLDPHLVSEHSVRSLLYYFFLNE